jgi:hypothetical protein
MQRTRFHVQKTSNFHRSKMGLVNVFSSLGLGGTMTNILSFRSMRSDSSCTCLFFHGETPSWNDLQSCTTFRLPVPLEKYDVTHKHTHSWMETHWRPSDLRQRDHACNSRRVFGVAPIGVYAALDIALVKRDYPANIGKSCWDVSIAWCHCRPYKF